MCPLVMFANGAWQKHYHLRVFSSRCPFQAKFGRKLHQGFIEGQPLSNDKDIILALIDRLSKSANFFMLAHPFTAKMVAAKFLGVVKLHGMPTSIISDQDPILLSNFWRDFFKMLGTQLKMSSAYLPQTNGQSEVVNRCMEYNLYCLVHQKPL